VGCGAPDNDYTMNNRVKRKPLRKITGKVWSTRGEVRCRLAAKRSEGERQFSPATCGLKQWRESHFRPRYQSKGGLAAHFTATRFREGRHYG
jgi:hypothetical protein